MIAELLFRVASFAGIIIYVVDLACIAALGYFFFKNQYVKMRMLLVAMIVYSLARSVFLALMQRYVWLSDATMMEVVKTKVTIPQESLGYIMMPVRSFIGGEGGYFIMYAYTHFLLPVIISCVIGVGVVLVLAAVRLWRREMFSLDDLFMLFGVMVLLSYPRSLFMVPLVFIFTFVLMAVAPESLQKAKAPFSLAIVVSGAVLAVIGNIIIAHSSLSAFVY